MSVLIDVVACANREAIEQGLAGCGELPQFRNALIPGWDYTPTVGDIDPPTNGIWRTPHLDPRDFYSDKKQAPRGMFDGANTAPAIEATIWRLLRIRPDPVDHRSDAGNQDFAEESADSADRNDPFAPLISTGKCTNRDLYIELIIGHPIRDIAGFCAELLQRQPEIGRLVIAKRFCEALKACPELERICWHKREIERRALMPPFFACVLLAELQRLAQNVCAQIFWSYLPFQSLSPNIDKGSQALALTQSHEATVVRLRKAIEEKRGKANERCRADTIYARCITKQVACAPFQTRLHQFTLTSNPDAGVAAVDNTARRFFEEIVQNGAPLLNFVSGLSRRSPSDALARHMATHIAWRPERSAKGGSRAHLPTNCFTFWGLEWFAHALRGLAQIHDAAKHWNRLHLPHNPWKQGKSQHGGIQHAIARLPFFWLETTDPNSFQQAALELSRRKSSNATGGNARALMHNREAGRVSSELQLADGPSQETGDVEQDDSRDDPENPLAIFDDPVTKIADRQVTKARKAASEVPRRGMPGYSAQYRPHLWLDKVGDDIGFWTGREIEHGARIYPIANRSCTIRNASSQALAILDDIARYQNKEASLHARVCQNLAMTMGPFSTDPMHLLPDFRP